MKRLRNYERKWKKYQMESNDMNIKELYNKMVIVSYVGVRKVKR